MINQYRKKAQLFFINGEFSDAKILYSHIGALLEVAYCEIYLGHIENAKKIIENFSQESPAHEWIKIFMQMIEAELFESPTFLQIRNFFEIDLSNLFFAKKKSYIENVINYVPVLANINGEIYKMAARVLKNNGQYDLAKMFLMQSLEIFYKDVETHFLLAEIFIKKNEIQTAKKHLEYIIEIGDYYPAKKLFYQIK